MLNKEFTIKLISQEGEFIIPSNCRFLINIDSNIYSKLISKRKYKVKSKVSKSVLSGFHKYLINREVPDINYDNFLEYDHLSKEFDIMKPLIQIYYKHKPSNLKSSIITLQHLNLEFIRGKKQVFADYYQTKYQKIIYILFHGNELDIFSPHFKDKELLLEACHNSKLDAIYNITHEVVVQGNFSYVLNKKEKTASIYREFKANKNVMFPRSIHYKSQEYIIKSISSNAINNDSTIKTIKFQKKSEFSFFQITSFSCANLSCIVIPPSVTEIGPFSFSYCKIDKLLFTKDTQIKKIDLHAFDNCVLDVITIPTCIEEVYFIAMKRLRLIRIMTCKKRNIKLSDDQQKLILTKTNFQEDNFDAILRSNGNITTALIPSYIKTIKKYAFCKRCMLESIQFQSNSILSKIESFSFCKTKLHYITFPSSVTRICSYCFDNCKELKEIEFLNDSKLKIIESNAFNESSLESLVLPSSVVDLCRGWCSGVMKLNSIKIIKCQKENIMFYNNDFIIGKTNLESDIYDILLFARRNIINATIPSFIEKIDHFAFEFCRSLKNVWFEKDSKLKIIESYAFSCSSLENIQIPLHVNKIQYYAFNSLLHSLKIEFVQNCELQTIGSYAFWFTRLDKIKIPRNVVRIYNCAFCDCKLKSIEFEDDSELNIIGYHAFQNNRFYSISIPTNVLEINLDEFYESSVNIIELNENLTEFSIRFHLSAILMIPINLRKFYKNL
ncbi:hypothetical protein M9Y10_000369 [Tritrichomonas musculus]|uniref:Uncharacterized protein n=1 Tax=Tritrichomonas musculus TaxID=1915356 RepID=A0ABR2L507_9EUKA